MHHLPSCRPVMSEELSPIHSIAISTSWGLAGARLITATSPTIMPADGIVWLPPDRNHAGAGGRPLGRRKGGALRLCHSRLKFFQTGTANRRCKESLYGSLHHRTGSPHTAPPAGEPPPGAQNAMSGHPRCYAVELPIGLLRDLPRGLLRGLPSGPLRDLPRGLLRDLPRECAAGMACPITTCRLRAVSLPL